MIGHLMCIVTVAAIVGVGANIHKKQWCFAVWMVTNASWAVYDFSIGAHAQGSLFVVYFALAVYGFVHWGKERK